MGHFVGLGWLILLMAVVNIEAQKKPSMTISSQCLGNLMHVDVGPHEGELLEVSAVIDNSSILLTPSLASQCGFSMKTDQLGNTVIFASIQNCFAENAGDKTFTTTLNLRLNGNQVVEDELYQVAETCHYANWASREIICDHNYMEVSVERAAPDEYVRPEHRLPRDSSKSSSPQCAVEKGPVGSGFRTITVVFFTPEERLMSMTEAQERGYGITSTPSRLVVRSPRPAPETYTETVAGVPMTVLKTSTIFEKKWLATQIDAAAACPILEGSVSFTQNTITWYLPWHIDPLISSGQFKLLEVHMGVDGQRLDAAEMAARQYSMSVSGAYVIIEIPIGAVGGYYKSHVQDEQCLLSYTIEPMIELHWSDETTHEDTRYKVLLPITTPLLSQPPQVADYTVPEERVFKVMLGPLGFNVALVNITLSSEVLSVADCNARGFNVLEHISPNSSLKVFTLQVPFTDPVVLKMKQMGHTVYFSYLAFDLLVLPELTPFSLTAYLEATSEDMVLPELTPFSLTAYLEATSGDIVPPTVTGSCDLQNFHVFVKYGTSGSNFETVVGKQVLTSDLAEQYSFAENGTHFSLQVPYSSPNVLFQAVEPSFIRSRLRVVLKNPETSTNIKEFSLACNFPSRLIECFPNGTITALAVKLESVPSLNPSHLTLRDPTCGPSFSDERYAYFVFTANTCGTTRKFLRTVMLYENEISLPGVHVDESKEKHRYALKISCYYNINTTNTVGFHTKPGMSEQLPESPKSELPVAMTLALVPPTVTGSCDLQNFHVFVKYGTSGSNFETVVGKQVLTSDLAEQYSFAENGTHFSLQVPYSSPNVLFQAVEPSFIRSRLRVVLKNPETSTNIKEFSLACNFPSRLIECFPNGTITALAVKLESVPSLNPSHLTLRDPTCGPSFSDERYAYFVFTANTCGTTRKFLRTVMLYENEISLPGVNESEEKHRYALKISCYYNINTTNTVGFHTKPGMSEQLPESPKSELPVAMRLALDDSYSVFHKLEDYPVTKYLQQPLYFEVELMESKEPDLSVELENCWATTNADGASQPRWNLIIDGCANSVDPYQAVYHPVWVNARVQNPSHFKRFEVQMFAFHDQDNLSGQLFIHCDVVTCHANKNQLGAVCNRQCSTGEPGKKGQRRAVSHVSSGPILPR